MFYYNNYWFGMHYIWWILWIILIVWIFATPWYFPGVNKRKETHLDILKRRLASGEISKEEYESLKTMLEDKK